jgi:dihydroneopterin aldolase
MINQSMKIQDYEVWVHLGCSLEEQKFTQPVHVTVTLIFHQPLNGMNTDHLSDAVDYVNLTELIKEVSLRKPYNLIEHLCYEVTLKISDFLKTKLVKGQLQIDLRKIRVPVENLRNGVVYTCETTL